jgi:hypothetical protein
MDPQGQDFPKKAPLPPRFGKKAPQRFSKQKAPKNFEKHKFVDLSCQHFLFSFLIYVSLIIIGNEYWKTFIILLVARHQHAKKKKKIIYILQFS